MCQIIIWDDTIFTQTVRQRRSLITIGHESLGFLLKLAHAEATSIFQYHWASVAESRSMLGRARRMVGLRELYRKAKSTSKAGTTTITWQKASFAEKIKVRSIKKDDQCDDEGGEHHSGRFRQPLALQFAIGLHIGLAVSCATPVDLLLAVLLHVPTPGPPFAALPTQPHLPTVEVHKTKVLLCSSFGRLNTTSIAIPLLINSS